MKVIAKMVAAGAGALGLAALGEGAARLALRRRGGHYRYVPFRRVRLALDREALPLLRPVIRIEINRDGERGGPPPRPGEDAYRALVVGGSAAEGIFLDQDQTWPAVIERVLGRPENLRALGVSRVHVGNVARAIVPCAEIDAMLRKLLPRYHRLDLVLVMVGASDLVRWMEQGLPRTLPDGDVDPSKLFEQHPEGPWGWTPRRTALWRIAVTLHRRLLRPVEQRSGGGDWLTRVRRMRAAATTILDQEPDATPMLDHFERHLHALLRTARSRAARVILVRQPWLGPSPGPEEARLVWNFGLGRPYREEVSTYFALPVVDALMRRVDARALAVARDLGVQQVDLSSRLERSARMFYDYLHFTPAGAEVVGSAVAEAIVAPTAAAPRVGEAASHVPK